MQETLSLFFQNYQYPALLLDLAGEVLYFNPATSTYFSELTTGKKLDLRVKNFFASINQALLVKKNLTINKYFLGSYCLLKFSLINDNNVNPTVLLLVEPEITLGRSQALGQESTDKLIQALVHELKAPLVTIFGFSSALEEDYSRVLDKEGINFLESISRSARNLDDKLMALVELTEVDRQAISKRFVGFKEILQDASSVLKSVIEKRNAEILITTELPNITCNPDLMVKVMVNLLSNAIKFTPQEHQPLVKIACSEQTKTYTFSVSDKGIGIDLRLQKKVFEPFYRAKELQRVSGIGLGLTLTRRIIQAHNGKLKVESLKGEGSSFYFVLPK